MDRFLSRFMYTNSHFPHAEMGGLDISIVSPGKPKSLCVYI